MADLITSTTNSQVTSSRSCDFMQLLVNMQQSTLRAPPTSSPYYLGETEGGAIMDSFTSVDWGPPYYCTTATVPTAGQGVSGFFTCN